MRNVESLAYKIDKAKNELRDDQGKYREATKRERIAQIWQMTKKEALKLSFAVVVTECILVVALHYGVKWGLYEIFQPKTVIINFSRPAEAKETMQEEVKTMQEKDIADLIWFRESTRGKNNYSKCTAIGKINGIGYNIPGNGKYQCFDSHEEEMIVLNGWLADHRSQGMSDIEMLCHYSGNNYSECIK